MSSRFDIAGTPVGDGSACFVIAEVAQAHDGSLGAAHAYIDAVAACGANAVKFQTHIADAESTPQEPFRVKFSYQDASRYDYWKRLEFTVQQWHGLADHARKVGLIFLSTPFSGEAVELLERLDVAAWKIASGEVTSLPLLERMAATGRPIIFSSGMSSWEDLDRAVEIVGKSAPYAILQCTTAYPCPPEKLGLNVLDDLRTRYACPVGLSDHSGTIYAGLAARTLGADLLEAHIVFSRQCFGPDTPASLTTDQFTDLVQGVRFIEAALSRPVDKEAMAAETAETRVIFGKSIVAVADLPAGHRLQETNLTLKKPGTGIPAAKFSQIVGRRLTRAVKANTLLSENDLE